MMLVVKLLVIGKQGGSTVIEVLVKFSLKQTLII